MPMWNPWHGCHKISAGCKHCYVFREDAAFGTEIPTNEVRKTSSFNLPVKRDRKKNWKFPSGTEFGLCFTSDLLIEEADEWRSEIWDMIRTKDDCSFYFFTKRIDRLEKCLAKDWGEGWNHVAIGCTVETQERADYIMPIFLSVPIKHRLVIVAPMIEQLDIQKYLDCELIEKVSVGGESGKYARPLDFNWVLNLKEQCVAANMPFNFHQTGSYIIKDGKQYYIPRPLQHSQAHKANVDYRPKR